MKLRTKISLFLIALSVSILAVTVIFIDYEFENYFMSRTLNELDMQINQIEYIFRNSKPNSKNIDTIYSQYREIANKAKLRLTFVTSEGKVIFESEKKNNQLHQIENHLSRPEIMEAAIKGTGVSERRSITIGVEMLYLVHKLNEGLIVSGLESEVTFIRAGIPLTQIKQAISEIRLKVIGISFIVLIVVIITTSVISKPLVKPINEIAKVAAAIREGNLEQRIDIGPIRRKNEIRNLAETINSMIQKLNDDIIQLKKLERVRTEFLGNVSHELRTPIFAIQASLETLLGGAIDDPTVNKQFLDKALINIHRLDTLLYDLIEISRIESGDMKMSFRYFDLEEFLKDTVFEMQQQAENKQIKINCKLLGEKVDVYGDKDRVKQALVNLIDNSIKYSEANGNVDIFYKKVENGVRITVQDTGYGISAEHLPHIFKRFYRVNKDRSREVGGTGLGLAIVKHIIEAHGSKVEAESEVGKGSSFSFVLKD
jgi:two-component system phosphate regulon sensor histidine kinase PhoR